MLRLTQAELAEKAGLSKVALIHIEAAAGKPKAATLAAIQRTLEIAGVEFTEEGPPGVRVQKMRVCALLRRKVFAVSPKFCGERLMPLEYE